MATENPYESEAMRDAARTINALDTALDLLRTQHRGQQIAWDEAALAARPDFAAIILDAGLHAELHKVYVWGQTCTQPVNAVLGNFGIVRILGPCTVQHDPTNGRVVLNFRHGVSLYSKAESKPLYIWTPDEIARLHEALDDLPWQERLMTYDRGAGLAGTLPWQRCSGDLIRASHRYGKHPFDSPKEDWDALLRPKGWEKG